MYIRINAIPNCINENCRHFQCISIILVYIHMSFVDSLFRFHLSTIQQILHLFEVICFRCSIKWVCVCMCVLPLTQVHRIHRHGHLTLTQLSGCWNCFYSWKPGDALDKITLITIQNINDNLKVCLYWIDIFMKHIYTLKLGLLLCSVYTSCEIRIYVCERWRKRMNTLLMKSQSFVA